MIDRRTTKAYKLEKENRVLKKEIERLNENNQAYQKELCKVWDERDNAYRIINELEKDMIERYHKEIDYQSKIMQSDLMQGDYPISYYYAEQNEKLLNYYLIILKELKGADKDD